MKLTVINRIKLVFEILTIRSGGHGHTAHEKQLSTFIRGYLAGIADHKLQQEAGK